MEELCAADTPRQMIWIRRDVERTSSSRERLFMLSLADQLMPSKVHKEAAQCRSAGGDCSYIMRNVFRNLPELISQGDFEDVISAFPDGVERDYLLSWKDPHASGRIVSHFEDRIGN